MWLNSTLVFLRDFGGWGFRSGATGILGGGGRIFFFGVTVFSFVGCSRGIGECGRSRAPIQVLTNDRESDAEAWFPSLLPRGSFRDTISEEIALRSPIEGRACARESTIVRSIGARQLGFIFF